MGERTLIEKVAGGGMVVSRFANAARQWDALPAGCSENEQREEATAAKLRCAVDGN